MSDPNKRRDSGTRMRLQQVIPGATHRFHEALDKLEDELTRARAVMRRDLAVLQRAREQRERAQAEAQAKAAHEGMNGTSGTGVMQTVGAQPVQDDDIMMLDEPASAPQPLEKPKTEPAAGTDAGKEQREKSKGTPSDIPTTRTSQPAASTLPATSDPLPVSSADNIFVIDATTNADGQHSSNNEIDFDGMFADLTPDTNQNATGDNGAAGGIGDHDLDLNFDDASGHVASLLPGLENYATIPEGGDLNANEGSAGASGTAGGLGDAELDFSMIGIPASTEQQKKPGEADQTQQTATDSLNLNFDINDLGGAGGDAGQQSNLDELFFNLDDMDYDADAAGGTGGENSAVDVDDMFDFFNN
jgi:hypothetical protein